MPSEKAAAADDLAVFLARLEDADCVTAAHVVGAAALAHDTDVMGAEPASGERYDEPSAIDPPEMRPPLSAPRKMARGKVAKAGKVAKVATPVAPQPCRGARSMVLVAAVLGIGLIGVSTALNRADRTALATTEAAAGPAFWLWELLQGFPKSRPAAKLADAAAVVPPEKPAQAASPAPNTGASPGNRRDEAAAVPPPAETAPAVSTMAGPPQRRLPPMAPLHVVVTFTTGNVAAQKRGIQLTHELRAAGYLVGDPEAVAEGSSVAAVNYFFPEDAEVVAKLVLTLGPTFGKGQLAGMPPGTPLRPGTVRVSLPSDTAITRSRLDSPG